MALLLLSSVRVRVDVKISNDRGRGTSSAGGPVTITFNKQFADITMLDAWPVSNAGEELKRIISFDDIPDPPGFDIEIYDSTGTPVVRDFRWEASGVLKTAA